MKPPFIDFEVSEGAGESGPAATYESIAQESLAPAEPVVEETPAVEEATPEPAAVEEPPAWFKQYMERAEPLLSAVQEAMQPEPQYQQPQQQVDLSQLDMSNPEHVAWLIDYRMQQAMAPYEPIIGMTAEQQGREVANKFFDQLEADPQVGAFDRDQALLSYQALMADNPGADPERVLEVAARQTADYERRIREQTIAEYEARQKADEERLRELADAKNQPPAGTGAAVENEDTPTGRDKYELLAQRWQTRQQRSPGLGV